ncbi:hypothetical protein HYV56_02135 [Candidatus Peregrinibacteria bacterium]|nr:hypothetical protein [Candidatus Peregrinibacteria bacterium]
MFFTLMTAVLAILLFLAAEQSQATDIIQKPVLNFGIWQESSAAIYPRDESLSVGIGTSTPRGKLDVYGDISIEGQVALQSSSDWLFINPNNEFSQGVHTGTKMLKHDGTFQVSDNLIFADSVNERVGIGTLSPQKTLEVNGDAAISQTLEAGGIDLKGDLIFSGTQTQSIKTLGPLCIGNC